MAKTVGDEGQQIGSGDTGKGSKEECWVDWRGLSWTPVETNGEGKTKQKQRKISFFSTMKSVRPAQMLRRQKDNRLGSSINRSPVVLPIKAVPFHRKISSAEAKKLPLKHTLACFHLNYLNMN